MTGVCLQAITKTKQSAFALGRMNPLKKSSLKRKEEREEKKKVSHGCTSTCTSTNTCRVSIQCCLYVCGAAVV